MIKETHIEGATPLVDVSGLILDFVSTREELIEAEYKNISLAARKYQTTKSFKYDISFFMKVHKDMFNYVWNWAGKTRTINLNIGVDYPYINIELKKLIDDLLYWEKDQRESIEVISLFHHRLVQIHPWVNGNGRAARLLTKIYARVSHGIILKWPDRQYLENTNYRSQYLAALKKADNMDFNDLILLHRECQS